MPPPIRPKDEFKHLQSESVVSIASSSVDLSPFEVITQEQAQFLEAIIERAPATGTSFIPVFKAYQDEFDSRGIDSTDDEFYYNILLKLGRIRAENWAERWRIVKDHLGLSLYASSSSSRLKPRHATASQDDDLFTLHSRAGSVVSGAPPSYHSRRPSLKGKDYRPSSDPVSAPSEITFAPQSQSSTKRGTGSLHAIATSVAPGVPPSYRTTTSKKPIDEKFKTNTRSDIETWKTIEKERNADLFRKEMLLSQCFDIWYQGLLWINLTGKQLDTARNEMLLSSVIEMWRQRVAFSAQKNKRAALVDRIRVMSNTLRRWREHARKCRRKRWADNMRSRMTTLQDRFSQNLLSNVLQKWRFANSLRNASRNYEISLARKAVLHWNKRLFEVMTLAQTAQIFIDRRDQSNLENALILWHRRLDLSQVATIIEQRRQSHLLSQKLKHWRRNAIKHSSASFFSDIRILRNALYSWGLRRAKVQEMERRAVSHQNKPLLRAVLRIWVVQERHNEFVRASNRKLLISAIHVWSQRLNHIRNNERRAMKFQAKNDKQLVRTYIHTWALRFAANMRLEKKAQKAYEFGLKSRYIMVWRTNLWHHIKAWRQAKRVKRVFLERMAFQKWKNAAVHRVHERKVATFVMEQLRMYLKLWNTAAKTQRTRRRKEEAVRNAADARHIKSFLQRWTLRVVYLKNREYDAMVDHREKILRLVIIQWSTKLQHQKENTSLMQSLQDVRREEHLRRMLSKWLNATRRNQILSEKEHEQKTSLKRQAWERWYDRYLENGLQSIELEVLLQSRTNLLFKTFRIWEARTPSIPAIRFRALHTRRLAFQKWKSVMPTALKAREARQFDRHILLSRSMQRWSNRYKTKVSMKAIARARYLRLPPAPVKQPASRLLSRPLSLPLAVKVESQRSSLITKSRAEVGRAPSPTSTKGSFHVLEGIVRRRPLLGRGPASVGGGSQVSSEDRRDASSWAGFGTNKPRPRSIASFGFGERTKRQPSAEDSDNN